MAELVARVYHDPEGFVAVVDGWGSFRGRTLADTVAATRDALENVVAGAFPDRPGIDPLGAELVVHFRISLSASARSASAEPPRKRQRSSRRGSRRSMSHRTTHRRADPGSVSSRP